MSRTNEPHNQDLMQEKAKSLGIDISTLKERIVEAWLLQEKRKETVEDIRRLQAELEIIDEKLEERKDYVIKGGFEALLRDSKRTCEAV